MTKLWGFLDFDNTQMHTEKLAIPSLVKRFNELYSHQLPTPLTLEEFHTHFHGQGKQTLCDNMSTHLGIQVDYPTLYEDRELYIMKMYQENSVEMADNLIETLSLLQQENTVFSLTSNNDVQRSIAAMRYATNGRGEELVSLFGTRMFEAGEKQKPNPAIYNNAVTQLEADKALSFCVEDSHTGVIAGREAGLTVFGFTGFAIDKEHLKQRQLEEGAIASFDHWSEFPTLLRQYFDLDQAA